MTPATVLLSPMRINVICIPMANTVAGTMRGRTVRKDIKSFPRNRYRIRALDVSTPIAADKTATTEEIIMLDAMREQGLAPIICSGYRTLDKQEKLFNRKVQSYVRSGHTKEESYALARQTISIPGSGEHCLGLAVDFYTKKYHKLEKAFENTPEGKWLMEHAQGYGFIMRYGEDKVDITGIEYEPWHYRYVGVEAAEYIKEHNLSLEEFYIEQSLYG